MRIGGLATGMDIDMLVGKLMKAERMPLDRMEQDRTTFTWKRDAYRDINKSLLELDNMTLNMKLDSTYNSKSVSSSMGDAVTATGTAGASNGVYKIEVTELAESAINVGGDLGSVDPNATLETQFGIVDPEDFTFYTYKEDGNPEAHSYTVNPGDTLNDVLGKITEDDNNVRAFFDKQSHKVVLETTRTGDYNPSGNPNSLTNNYGGAEIGFDTSSAPFLTNKLKLTTVVTKNAAGDVITGESGGKDAEFTYNGVLDLKSKDNNYTLNDINFEFKNTTGGASATLTVDNNVQASFDSIMKFVDKYNQLIEKLNDTQQEEIYRDYKPLTDKQKEELSEDEVKLWEEKAKSGILKNESIISDGMFKMRNDWYSNVENGDYNSLTQIGITTSKDFLDGGKLIVDEEDLKKALSENPNGVKDLLSNDEEGSSRGIINRLDDSLESIKGRIEERAGKGTDTLENYTLGKRMKDLNEQISDFENRLVRVEDRYWSQFTAMEKAIQRMNQQSAQLMSQFGGA